MILSFLFSYFIFSNFSLTLPLQFDLVFNIYISFYVYLNLILLFHLYVVFYWYFISDILFVIIFI